MATLQVKLDQPFAVWLFPSAFSLFKVHFTFFITEEFALVMEQIDSSQFARPNQIK